MHCIKLFGIDYNKLDKKLTKMTDLKHLLSKKEITISEWIFPHLTQTPTFCYPLHHVSHNKVGATQLSSAVCGSAQRYIYLALWSLQQIDLEPTRHQPTGGFWRAICLQRCHWPWCGIWSSKSGTDVESCYFLLANMADFRSPWSICLKRAVL